MQSAKVNDVEPLDYSESPAPSKIVALLERLECARGSGIDPSRVGRIHAARLVRLIDEAVIMTVQHIADLEPARRTAILTVQVASLETRLSRAKPGESFEAHQPATGDSSDVDPRT